MSHPLFNLFIIFSSSDYTELSEEHSCYTDYARNLNGKRPMRSRRLKPHVIRSRRFRRWRRFFLIVFLSHRFHDFTFFCPIDFTDLHRFIFWLTLFLCHADFADFADFSIIRFFCPTDFTDLHRFRPVRSMGWRRFFFI